LLDNIYLIEEVFNIMADSILIVEDDASVRESLLSVLESKDYVVESVSDGEQAVKAIEQRDYDVLLLDLQLPKISGMEVLANAKKLSPDTSIVILTAHGSIQSAVEAMKLGAEDYLEKPCDIEQLQKMLEKIFARKLFLRREKKGTERKRSFEGIIGESPPMQRIYELIETVAKSDSNILIMGETGTGKDLVARAIHNISNRRKKPFVKVDCTAIPRELLESELFGHEKGAFTGAVVKREGKFQQANGGTLFLDEVGNLPEYVQMKLLNVLQDRQVTPIGASAPIDVDIRLLAATNVDLLKEVKNGDFREDLYYRLDVVTIDLPALRDRKADIPLLIDHFLQVYNIHHHGKPNSISPEALELLMRYSWPGNVRELENVIEEVCILRDKQTIETQDLPLNILNEVIYIPKRFCRPSSRVTEVKPLQEAVEDSEESAVTKALAATKGNKKAAAKLLGISRVTLYEKIRKYGISIQRT
jgi:DNA-binding NtrC family response regulator